MTAVYFIEQTMYPVFIIACFIMFRTSRFDYSAGLVSVWVIAATVIALVNG